ncbi:MAG: cation:proton antiporter [Pseudomonadales bacterium]|nr:cation:proton antiporter [Pseudomonadales bacterium]MCP5193590.1 cation:proton antiporter [Pseudomonadales bacterium]
MNRPKRILWLLLLAAMLLPGLALANGVSETFTQTSLLLILMITLADVCGFIFERLGMAEILGEIYAGIMLGNLALLGIDFDLSNLLRSSEFMVYSSELALVLLLFLVGLESDMRDLLRVGRNAVAVAVTGVALPVLLGLAAGAVLGYGMGVEGWFVGAMLAATSVGITAKLLGDNGLVNTNSARVILGAAVIDDVVGILLLAVLASVVVSGEVSALELLWIVAKALLFFAGALLVGQKFMPGVIHIISLNKHSSVWTGFALCLALAFAQLAHFAGLAPLIGAFMAGLILDDVDFKVGDALQKHRLEELVKPISDIMITIFFVGIGAQVQLQALLEPQVLLIITVLTVVAIVSKGAAGYMVRGKDFDRPGIGFGMIPRGEVGLVFAAFAFSHNVFSADLYSALVLVVLLTTLVGPLLLKPRLARF